MKKETIIAIILGIAFGGLVAYFLIVKNKEFQLNKTKVIAPTGTISNTAIKETVSIVPLEIDQPISDMIVAENSISIKGRVTKDSLIVIESPIAERVFTNQKEDFSIDFPLVLGENAIKLVVYPNDKQVRTQEKDLKVYYLKEEL